MAGRRKREGFERLGPIEPRDLELSARRARQWLVGLAWAELAGESPAREIVVEGLERGVLLLGTEDETWPAALESLRQLAGRLVARYPSLGIRKLRLRCGGISMPAVEVVPEPDPAPPEPKGRPEGSPSSERPPDEFESRLRAIARRYLERAAARRERSSR